MADILRLPPRKGVNKGAYRGSLNCPFFGCDGKSHRWIENVTPYRLRYRCRKCGRTFQYDISNRRDNPYAVFNTPHFRKVVAESKRGPKGSNK